MAPENAPRPAGGKGSTGGRADRLRRGGGLASASGVRQGGDASRPPAPPPTPNRVRRWDSATDAQFRPKPRHMLQDVGRASNRIMEQMRKVLLLQTAIIATTAPLPPSPPPPPPSAKAIATRPASPPARSRLRPPVTTHWSVLGRDQPCTAPPDDGSVRLKTGGNGSVGSIDERCGESVAPPPPPPPPPQASKQRQDARHDSSPLPNHRAPCVHHRAPPTRHTPPTTHVRSPPASMGSRRGDAAAPVERRRQSALGQV